MAVYVDSMRDVAVRIGRRTYHEACHMMADTDEELETIRAQIGLLRGWRDYDHYDLLTVAKRQAAVAAGAIEVKSSDLVRLRRRRRREKLRDDHALADGDLPASAPVA